MIPTLLKCAAERTMPESVRIAGPSGDKFAIIHAVGVVLDQIEHAADRDNGSGQQDAGLQKPADDGFEAAIVHAVRPSP